MEFDLIDRIRARCGLTRADVVLGIGDDAALLMPPLGHELVVSTDALVEGVHFPRGTAPRDLGWKALAVNLSDLAAMGATPAWALLTLVLPQADAALSPAPRRTHARCSSSVSHAAIATPNGGAYGMRSPGIPDGCVAASPSKAVTTKESPNFSTTEQA